jgi:putative transposase
MPRIARVCAVNHPHHITQRGNNRGIVFFDDEDRRSYLQILGRYSYQWDLNIWAYCLMPNHIHLLAVPRSEDSLSKGIGGTSLVYTQYVNHRYGRSGRLWQNRFFSATVEKESYLWAVARYIEQNPVRANFTERPEDYPWSSAKAHVFGTGDHILSRESWLETSELHAYREFLREENKEIENSIRKATSTGRPFGEESFVRTIGTMVERDLAPRNVGRPSKMEEK